MSLVQYSSSDESETEEVPQKAPIIAAKSTESSISSFLPPPKNRAPPSIPKARALGHGIKQRVSTEIAHNQDGIALPKSNRAITSFVPTSVRNKAKGSDVKTQDKTPMEKNELPAIQVFQTVKTTKPKQVEEEKVLLQPVTQSLKRPLENELEPQRPLENKLEPQQSEPVVEEERVREFNVNNFYQENMELKEKGELRENKHLHTVTNHKNQLTSLMKNAAQDEELLKEKFERNKRARKERGERYGW